MNTHLLLLRKCAGLLCATSVASVAHGQVTLIGPSTRNGSFEDGVLAPWTVTGQAAFVRDPQFASDGEWYGSLSITALASGVRPSLFQAVDADRNDGLTFWLTFDVRNGTAAFERISISFAAQNSDASFVFFTNAFFGLSLLEWQDIEMECRLPDTWDGGGNISLGLQLENHNAVAGTAYTGYLDNVVLTQVPEPSAWVLLAITGLVFVGRAVRRG